MKETNLKSTKANLIKLVMKTSTEQTIKDIQSEWNNICKEYGHKIAAGNKALLEWVMECFFTYEQPGALMIVKNLKTGTWNIVETDDELIETENSLAFADWTGRS